MFARSECRAHSVDKVSLRVNSWLWAQISMFVTAGAVRVLSQENSRWKELPRGIKRK